MKSTDARHDIALNFLRPLTPTPRFILCSEAVEKKVFARTLQRLYNLQLIYSYRMLQIWRVCMFITVPAGMFQCIFSETTDFLKYL
jgi:hypothetical protein